MLYKENMDLFEKIDNYVGYSDRKENFNYNKYNIFEICKLLENKTKKERDKILSFLDKNKVEEIKKLEEGGLL